MRLKAGSQLLVFNGEDGEWSANVETLDRKRGSLVCLTQQRPQPPPSAAAPDLLFGVLKGSRLPTLVEKATELGVGALQPVVMRHCAARSLNVDRLQAIATEAAEQSRRLSVPVVAEPESSLASALARWDPERVLFVCDERSGEAATPSLASAVASLDGSSSSSSRAPGILIGPEGGFAREEFEELAACDFVRSVSLGANTLRAETAALAACAVFACREV